MTEAKFLLIHWDRNQLRTLKNNYENSYSIYSRYSYCIGFHQSIILFNGCNNTRYRASNTSWTVTSSLGLTKRWNYRSQYRMAVHDVPKRSCTFPWISSIKMITIEWRNLQTDENCSAYFATGSSGRRNYRSQNTAPIGSLENCERLKNMDDWIIRCTMVQQIYF